MIEVLFYDTKKLPANASLDFLIKDFSVEDKERALRYRTVQDGINFAIGRLMLQSALKSKGINPDLIYRLFINNSGKPTLPNLFFNISHSGSYVVCAFSEEIEMGIDIEVIREMDVPNFKSWFTPNEWNTIQESTNPSLTLLNYWTAKESVLKLVGTDLAKAADIEVITEDKAIYNNEIYGIKYFEFYTSQLQTATKGGKVIGHCCVSLCETATNGDINEIFLREWYLN